GHRDMLLSRGTALPSRRVVRPAGAGAGEGVEPAGAGPDGVVGPTGTAGAAGADGRARAAGSRVAARVRAAVPARSERVDAGEAGGGAGLVGGQRVGQDVQAQGRPVDLLAHDGGLLRGPEPLQ